MEKKYKENNKIKQNKKNSKANTWQNIQLTNWTSNKIV